MVQREGAVVAWGDLLVPLVPGAQLPQEIQRLRVQMQPQLRGHLQARPADAPAAAGRGCRGAGLRGVHVVREEAHRGLETGRGVGRPLRPVHRGRVRRPALLVTAVSDSKGLTVLLVVPRAAVPFASPAPSNVLVAGGGGLLVLLPRGGGRAAAARHELGGPEVHGGALVLQQLVQHRPGLRPRHRARGGGRALRASRGGDIGGRAR
mmetsp:Transcript_40877/g.91993  ORF Transcript_40877/g.91993 Transcript_40877/m.91993 type:complete len:207 (-) Transcript_40877:119-739(-)